MDMGPRISRKLDFMPPLATVLAGGWELDPALQEEVVMELAPDVETQHICGASGCMIKRDYSYKSHHSSYDSKTAS